MRAGKSGNFISGKRETYPRLAPAAGELRGLEKGVKVISKILERYDGVCRHDANSYVVLAGCDDCKGQFLFAGMKVQSDGPFPLTGEFYQFDLIRFCPFCGSRNTKPRPVADGDKR